jgi:hypothetical protein
MLTELRRRQVYFSSSAQMADLIEDISRDLDSGRFDILPSHEAISSPTLTSTSGSITPREAKPVAPLGARLQVGPGACGRASEKTTADLEVHLRRRFSRNTSERPCQHD